MKKFFKILLIILSVIIALAAALIGLLSITEYKPADVEEKEISGSATAEIKLDEEISIVSWNIGYSALGENNDFAMDGGNTPPASKEQVLDYYGGIQSFFKSETPTINLFQEVDIDATRSFGIDQREGLSRKNGTFALNYKCLFVPFPWPPMGKINAGLFTTSNLKIESAERISLPCPFSWPLKVANLKRCLLVSYFPIQNSDKKLVVINLHLEAYTEDEGRIAQMKILNQFMEEEYAKGNYVIAGGDFNQIFPNTTKKYPNTHKDNWDPNELSADLINRDFKYVYDDSEPTCRLLNGPYNPSDTEQTQYYVIDGFIVTPNINVKSIETLNMNFEDSDHNPVKIIFELVK